jgi:hypothetical protein
LGSIIIRDLTLPPSFKSKTSIDRVKNVISEAYNSGGLSFFSAVLNLLTNPQKTIDILPAGRPKTSSQYTLFLPNNHLIVKKNLKYSSKISKFSCIFLEKDTFVRVERLLSDFVNAALL